MKRFALIGGAGYVAPRHMRAIKDTGNELVAVLDPNDSVGVIDSYFPKADFFTEFERFDRHIDKKKRSGENINYVAICSPNYLHDAHIRFALRSGAHAICEKPLVLNPWNIDGLQEVEKDFGKKVYNILQLRLHPSIIALKKKIEEKQVESKYEIDLTYITSRGNWYFSSWKGDESKSGGIASNIGIHFYDMLMWIFGGVQLNVVHHRNASTASGFLELENARVRWFLSVDETTLPDEVREVGQRTYRSITVEDEELEFSGGFTDLHTMSFQDILEGGGFGLQEARPSIEVVQHIRNADVVMQKDFVHPFIAK
jgi:UDP-N-acetyl-2-amino-2-deoxyglucuronate dehydrogenase